MNLRVLLTLYGLVTLAAGVVLIVAPGLVPSAVGIGLPEDPHLLGVHASIWANVALRPAVIALFTLYGLRRKRPA